MFLCSRVRSLLEQKPQSLMRRQEVRPIPPKRISSPSKKCLNRSLAAVTSPWSGRSGLAIRTQYGPSLFPNPSPSYRQAELTHCTTLLCRAVPASSKRRKKGWKLTNRRPQQTSKTSSRESMGLRKSMSAAPVHGMCPTHSQVPKQTPRVRKYQKTKSFSNSVIQRPYQFGNSIRRRLSKR